MFSRFWRGSNGWAKVLALLLAFAAVAPALAVEVAAARVVWWSDRHQLHRADARSLQVELSLPLPSVAMAPVADGSLWVLGQDRHLHRLSAEGTVLTRFDVRRLRPADLPPSTLPPLLAADPRDGSAWLSWRGRCEPRPLRCQNLLQRVSRDGIVTVQSSVATRGGPARSVAVDHHQRVWLLGALDLELLDREGSRVAYAATRHIALGPLVLDPLTGRAAYLGAGGTGTPRPLRVAVEFNGATLTQHEAPDADRPVAIDPRTGRLLALRRTHWSSAAGPHVATASAGAAPQGARWLGSGVLHGTTGQAWLPIVGSNGRPGVAVYAASGEQLKLLPTPAPITAIAAPALTLVPRLSFLSPDEGAPVDTLLPEWQLRAELRCDTADCALPAERAGAFTFSGDLDGAAIAAADVVHDDAASPFRYRPGAALGQGPHRLTLRAHDRFGQTSAPASRSLVVATLPPPFLAPPLDLSAATSLHTGTRFLYSGAAPVQTGIAADTLVPQRVAVVRGTVADRQGQPLPGVTVSLLGRPEYGQTLSRPDGRYDLAVNGGEPLVLNFSAPDHLPVQRRVSPRWGQFAVLDEVVLSPLDAAVTVLSANAPQWQSARGSLVADDSGSRRASLLVPPGTRATMRLPDGSEAPLPTLSVRATEFSVGSAGVRAMPGELPPASGYTYAVELSVDEALAAGAQRVQFSQPLSLYVENFLGFATGMAVPLGWYDRQRGAWVPAPNGRVVRVVEHVDGLARVDTDGDGVADNAGIPDEEARVLASLYAPGGTLWRLQIDHFTPWDCNWPYGPPPGSVPPPKLGLDPPPCSAVSLSGSIIECESQALGEELSIVGAPFTLRYHSAAVRGGGGHTLDLPLSGDTVPPGVRRIDIEATVAGQVLKASVAPAAQARHALSWDGRDGYGRPVNGAQAATVRVGYVYEAQYYTPAELPAAFAAAGREPITGRPARQEVTLWREATVPLGTLARGPQAIGGWQASVVHSADPASGRVLLGSGSRLQTDPVRSRALVPRTLASAEHGLQRPGFVSVDRAGNTYVFDAAARRVSRIAPDGQLSIAVELAAGGADAFTAHHVGKDGSHFFGRKGSGGHRIDTLDASGQWTPLPGATQIAGEVRAIRQGLAGELYFVESGGAFSCGGDGVRRLDRDGRLVTVLGKDDCAGSGSTPIGWHDLQFTPVRAVGSFIKAAVPAPDPFTPPEPEREVHVNFGQINAIDVDSAGGVFTGHLEDSGIHFVTALGADGLARIVAGGSRFKIDARPGDGMPVDAWPSRIVLRGDQIAADGSGGAWVAEGYGTVYHWETGFEGMPTRLSGAVRHADGLSIRTLLGGEPVASPGTPAPGQLSGTEPDARACWQHTVRCSQAPRDARHLRIAAHPGGGFVVSDAIAQRVTHFAPAGFGGASGEFQVASADGSEFFVFSSEGRHRRTLDARTGQPVMRFGYDASGALVSVTDAAGQATVIERDAAGQASAIVAPQRQRTALSSDGNGFLASVADPMGHTHHLVHDSGGLLTSLSTPRGRVATMAYDTQGRLLRDADGAGGSWDLARRELPAQAQAGADTLLRQSGFETSQTSALGRVYRQRVEFMATGELQRLLSTPDGAQRTIVTSVDGSTRTRHADGGLGSSSRKPDPRFGLHAPLYTSRLTLPSGRSRLMVEDAAVVLADPADPADPFSFTEETRSVTLNGKATVSTYTTAQRQTITTSPSGRRQRWRIDAAGRLVEAEQGGLALTSYEHDTLGRLSRISQGQGAEQRSLSLAYGADGFVSTLSDALSQRVLLQRDAAGRITQAALPGQRSVQMDHDASSNLTALAPPARPAHRFAYDLRDEAVRYTPPAVPDVTDTATHTTYNADRQPTLISRPDGSQLALGYGADSGLLLSLTPSAGVGAAVTLGYSPSSGQLVSLSTADSSLGLGYDGLLLTRVEHGGHVTGRVEYGYDDDFKLTSLSVGGAALALSHDLDGLLTSAGSLQITRHPQHGLITDTLLASVGTRSSYNAFGELAESSAATAQGALYQLLLQYDVLGRVVGKTETVLGAATQRSYGYDEAGRLATVHEGSAELARYGYDANGNRTHLNGLEVASHDDQDRLLRQGNTHYTHSAAGEVVEARNGSQITRYTHDIFGNLLAVALPDGKRIEYLIDAAQRRVGKRVDGTVVRRWLYQDTLRIAAEVDAAGAVLTRFVYGERPNVPEYLTRNGEDFRVVTDHLGSVRLVVHATTGQVMQRIDYDEWGRVVADSNPGFQPFGFAGGLYDADTGLVRFGARDYDAETGRWIRLDPIRFAGGLNAFAYAGSDPASLVDIDGRIPVQVITTILGAGAGAIGNIVGQMATIRCKPFSAIDLFTATAGGALVGFAAPFFPGRTLGAVALGGFANLVQSRVASYMKGAEASSASEVASVVTGMVGGSIAGAVARGSTAAIDVLLNTSAGNFLRNVAGGVVGNAPVTDMCDCQAK